MVVYTSYLYLLLPMVLPPQMVHPLLSFPLSKICLYGIVALVIRHFILFRKYLWIVILVLVLHRVNFVTLVKWLRVIDSRFLFLLLDQLNHLLKCTLIFGNLPR